MNVRYFVGLFAMMVSLNAFGVQLVSMKVHVHEEDGSPVEDAYVRGTFFQDQVVDSKILASHQGATDSKGIVELSGHEEIYVDLTVKKDGYYDSKKRVNVRGDRGREVSVVLRPKRNPIAMYAKKVLLSARGNRESGKQFGYDLVQGDFVSPHGKGTVSDLLVTHTYARVDPWNYSYKLIINFNNPDDGLMPFYASSKESDYVSGYFSPIDGYINNWIIKGERSGKGKPVIENRDLKRNYYFRVRSQVNGNGNIISALYGKIYGDFPEIIYYLNQTSNDRNVEFDLKKNLFKSLKPEERVVAP